MDEVVPETREHSLPETNAEPDTTQSTEASEVPDTTTSEVTDTTTSEVEDVTEETVLPDDAKVADTTEAKTEEVSESADKETEVESVATEKTIAPEKQQVRHKGKKAKGKDAGRHSYAYDAGNYVVDEKNIFSSKKMNVIGENLNIFGKPRQSAFGPVVSFSSSGGEEGEEYLGDRRSYLFDELFQPTAEVSIPIDREAYMDEYRTLMNQKVALRQKNGILNRKISEYYRKRKNDRVFDDVSPDIYEELSFKYERKIDDLYEFRSKTQREREAIENEITDMRQQRDDYKIELASTFQAMLVREQEVAAGLIDTKTGKTISDKLIVTLIHRQTTKSTQIGVIRLGFIKKRDKVRDIEAMLKSLETIGGTLHLMDFEQIRMENQTFSDKIEERDDELMRLRTRFSKAIQELAHVRLKSHVLEEKIINLEEQTEKVERKVSKVREYLTNLKLTRDANRSQTSKLQLNSGLLTHIKLLRDFELYMNKLSVLEQNYEHMREINKDTRAKIVAIRQNMEELDREQYLQKRLHPEIETKHSKQNPHKKKSNVFKLGVHVHELK